MNPVPEMILPNSNFALQSSDFRHQLLEFNILLKMQTIIRNKFQPLLDESKNGDLLVRTQLPVFVLIEYAHELFDWTYLGEVVELRLELPENQLKDLLG